MFLFNVRAYGILINSSNEVLISDESTENVSFTKFPGGGLEYGEGLLDAVKREFMEETGLNIEVVRHIYTTDFYEKSSFNESQIISVYYEIKALNEIDFQELNKTLIDARNLNYVKEQEFRWRPVLDLKEDELTFKTDKVAWKIFRMMLNK